MRTPKPDTFAANVKHKARSISEVAGQKFRRSFVIDASRAIDVENRTVDLSFSSEEPAKQSFGGEILDHSPGACDLSRLVDGGHPLLWMHNWEKQIGVVLTARVDDDRRGRCRVKFSKSDEGQENFVDVQDGIKTKVSVGYEILAWVLESMDEESGEGTYRVTSWRPYEVSLVSIPADATVGVGRSMAEKPSLPETSEKSKETNSMTKEQIAAIRKIASDYATRVKAGLNLQDEAIRFISEEKTPEAFTAFVLENIRDNSAAAGNVTEVKTGNNASRAQIASAIKDVVSDKGSRSLKVGFRTFDASATKGSEMIGVEVKQTIDILRAKSALLGAGAQLLTGLRSNVRYPRITGAAAAAWAAKGAAAGGTAPATGSVELSPKRLAITFNVDKQFLAQVANAEAWLENQLDLALAHGLDQAGIDGDGDLEPTGILGTDGIGEVTFGEAGIVWSKVTEFLGTIATGNYDFETCKWVISPTTMARAMSVQKAAGLGFIMEGGSIAGYGAKVTTKIAGNKTLFGDAAQSVFAIFGDGYDITLDPYTRAAYGEIVVTGQVLADFAVLQPAAFAVSTDSAVPSVS